MTAPDVRVLPDAAAAVPLLLDEVRRVLAASPRALLGFATGGTFGPFLRALGDAIAAGEIAPSFLATHLDEYVGYAPDRAGGMVHELLTACPPLHAMLARGTFLPVPHVDDAGVLSAHEERLARAGGVQLQLVGLGRNGHVAFHEPGVPLERGVHVATLAESTRADARARFAPGEVPARAVTSGVATIRACKRVVLCAFGAAKAEAVRAMCEGPLDASCPASGLRGHANLLVLLDPAAASRRAGARAAVAGAVELRAATPADEAPIAQVLRAAFPTDVESRLVALLRANGRAVIELVAVDGGRVVGHVLCSPVTVGGSAAGGGLGLAPLAVSPSHRRRGVGAALVHEALATARAREAGFVVLLGAPRYYARFGFTRADARGLGNEYGAGPEFQVLELRAGALPAGGGLVRYGDEFGRFAFE
jgi:predicted N-acetyltransferase YhbS/6-phosphogluconolactonase/glucosamine-6-phosphate isomerase/deaminase